MSQSVELIATSVEKDGSVTNASLVKDMITMAGKASGICYMPNDYLDNGIQDVAKATKRAKGNAKSGHYSVFEHGHLSFIIHTSKIIAMILNSSGLYSTSEKSARYTKMEAVSEDEKAIYDKWTEKFSAIIKEKFNDEYTDKEVEKLAIENARYMLDVFTPTVMEFTVPHGRAMLIPGMLTELANRLKNHNVKSRSIKYINDFYIKLAKEVEDFVKVFTKAIGGKKNLLLDNHKNQTIGFLAEFNYPEDMQEDVNTIFSMGNFASEIGYSTYESIYYGSFAELAQAQRHRTINYEAVFDLDNGGISLYIPKIIRETEYQQEWIDDFTTLFKAGVIPQCTLLKIYEKGSVDKFVLKAKERMCSRAQLEITEVTYFQIKTMLLQGQSEIEMGHPIMLGYHELSKLIDDNGEPCYRCMYKDYECKEPCTRIKEFKNRII